jgi:hypothetical protein
MALTQKTLRKLRRRKPTSLPPEARRQLAPFVKALTGKDVVQRQKVVRCVVERAIPRIRDWLLDRLIACLRRRNDATCAPVLDSLAELGDLAVPALCDVLAVEDNPVVQARAIEVLGRAGPTLLLGRQFLIEELLHAILRRTQDELVVQATLRAMERLRPGSAAAEVALRALGAQLNLNASPEADGPEPQPKEIAP